MELLAGRGETNYKDAGRKNACELFGPDGQAGTHRPLALFALHIPKAPRGNGCLEGELHDRAILMISIGDRAILMMSIRS